MIKFQSVANSAKEAIENGELMSVHRDSGIPCSGNNAFMIDIVFAGLHCDVGIL